MKTIVVFVFLIALPVAAQSEGLSPRHRHLRAKVMPSADAASTPAARLATLLEDVRSSRATLSAAAWGAIADEAMALAKKLGPGATAHEARKHIADLRAAVLADDPDATRRHAALALPLVLDANTQDSALSTQH